MSLISILLRCLSNLKNGTQLISSVDVFEKNINRSVVSNEALNNVLINPFFYLDKDDKTISCDEIVKGILEIFNAYIFYKDGKYFIERINYKTQNILTRRTYTIDFNNESSTTCLVTSDNILSQISKTGNLKFINADQNITYQTPYRNVVINNQPAITEKIIVNPYFRKWNVDNTLPINWFKSGTLNIEKIPYQYTGDALKVKTVTINDSSINYNSNFLKTEKTLYNGLASDKDTLTLNLSYIGYVRFMVKVVTLTGLQYLRSQTVNNETVYSWTTTPSHLKLVNETRDSVRAPVGSNSGEITWSNVSEATLPIPYGAYNKIEAYLLPAYSGTTYQIREFQINYNVEKAFGGLVYSQKSNKAHTDVYDSEPKLGEFSSTFILNQLYIGTGTTENWYREDKSSENFSLLYLTSKSILNQTRTPFKKFTGSFIGEFNIGNIYLIEGLNGRLIPLKASTDLKSETHNIDFYELLDEVDDVNDTFTILLQYDKGYQVINNASDSGIAAPRPKRP